MLPLASYIKNRMIPTLVGTIQEKPIFYWVYLYATSEFTSQFYLIVPKYDTSAGNIKEPQKISRKYRWIPRWYTKV